MSNIVEVLSKLIKPYKRNIFIVLLFILFGYVSYYCFTHYYMSKAKDVIFKDVANANTSKKSIEIFFFYATWCPHCKTALPEWSKFKEEYDGNDIGEYRIKCMDMNCTDDSNTKVTQTVKEFAVDSYPTVKAMKENIQIDFDAKVTKYNLEQFVHSITTS